MGISDTTSTQSDLFTGSMERRQKKVPGSKPFLLHSLGANAKLLNLSHLICWHLSGLRLNPPRGVTRSALLLQTIPIPSNR